MLQPGDWVVWGVGHCGQLRYYSSDYRVAYVKEDGKDDLTSVLSGKLRPLRREETA
jgi:hypothetical protein